MVDDFKPGFFRTLVLLRDYLPVIVIGGGWAPLTYGAVSRKLTIISQSKLPLWNGNKYEQPRTI